MTPERRNQIDKLVQATLDLAPPQRTAFLDEACAADGSLRREVESLLAPHKSSITPFDAETEIAILGANLPGKLQP